MNMKKFIRILCLVAVLAMMVASPVLAYTYVCDITVQETDGNDYGYMVLSLPIDNQALADANYIESTALDTRILSYGSVERPHMVADDRVNWYAWIINGNSTEHFDYTFGNDDLTSMAIVPGYNGLVTTPEDVDLRPGNDFEINFQGYVNTSLIGERILRKSGAMQVEVSADNEITAGIINTESQINVTPGPNGSWEDVNVSAYVPAGATGVILEIVGSNDNAGVRKNGSTDVAYNGDITGHQMMMVGIDTNRVFEAYKENADVIFYLVGYTTAGWTYNTNWVDIDAATSGVWTDKDITAQTSATADLALFYVGPGSYTWGARPNGNVQDLTSSMGADDWNFCIVGLDSTQDFEYYVSNAALNFILIGWYDNSAGDSEFTTKVNHSLAGTGAVTEIDLSASIPSTATSVLFEVEDSNSNAWTLFNDWYSDYNYLGSDNRGMFIVPVDTRQQCYGEIANTGTDFYLLGYLSNSIVWLNQIVTYSHDATVAAVTPGIRRIVVEADGADMTLTVYDAGVTPETEIGHDHALAIGAGVPTSIYDWVLMAGNTMPYMNFYEHSVDSGGGLTLIADYEPIDMIISSILPDLEGGEENGVIAWGSNPSGIDITIGSAVPSGQIAPFVTGETDPEDIISPGGMPAIDYSIPTAGTIARSIYDLVDTMVDAGNDVIFPNLLPPTMVLINVGSMLIALAVIGYVAIKVPNHHLLAFVAGLIVSGVFVGLQFLPWWVMIIYVPVGIALLVFERKPVF